MVAFFCSFELPIRKHKYQVMRQICLIIQLFFCFSFCAQQNIGYVNYKQLLDSLPCRKEALIKVSLCESDENTLLNELNQSFSTLIEKCTETEWSFKIKKEKLQKLQNQIIEKEKKKQQLLLTYSEELNKPILDRIQKAIEIIAERKNLNYIFDESVSPYFKIGIDCTAEVLIELLKLDAEYMKK